MVELLLFAAEPRAGGDRERDGGGVPTPFAGGWAVVSGAGTSAVYWGEGNFGLRAGWIAGGRAVGAADAIDLRGGGCVSQTADSLDVVPAIGGLAIGLGGLVFPQALGVGYDTIGSLLQGSVTTHVILGVLLVKWFIWAVSLGSGTSGGVLAPLLMMGGALGGLEAMFLPAEGAGFWPLISMAAVMGGTMRAPLMSIISAFELTHDGNSLLPLLIASLMSYSVTVLTLKRSILTEKVARRGYHLSCEYAVDPLEILYVREVMRANVVALPASGKLREVQDLLPVDLEHPQEQRLLPVVDADGRLVGVLTRGDMREAIAHDGDAALERLLSDIVRRETVETAPNEPLRAAVYRMAEHGVTRMPVVERETGKFVGLISLDDLLKGRARHLEEERRRGRPLRLEGLFGSEVEEEEKAERVAR
jgi:CIC family chloride channel protein